MYILNGCQTIKADNTTASVAFVGQGQKRDLDHFSVKNSRPSHQLVSGSLTLLLFIGLDLPLGSRAAVTIGDKVL